MQHFFIGGAPKSGTTWAQKALDLHPEISCSGEGHLHEHIVAPMWNMFQDYNKKLSYVADIVYEGKGGIPQLGSDEVVECIRTILDGLLARKKKTGAKIFGDKTPKYYLYLKDLNVFFPDARFIIMLRDPRDVAASRLYHARRSGYEGALDRNSEAQAAVVKASINDWLNCVKRSSEFQARYPSRLFFQRYEDMLRDPGEAVAGMIAFLGAEVSRAQVLHITEAASFAKLSGRAPGVEDATSFFRKGISGDWPNVLDPSMADYILRFCADDMRNAGYAV